MKTTFITCKHCSSNACVETLIENSPTLAWFCYTCGFESSTLYTEDNQYILEYIEGLPELHKQITKTIDGLKYFPITMNIPDKGMIFIDGTNTENYHWVGVLAVDIDESEKEKFPIPGKPGEFYQKKMDMKTLKQFDKHNFMDALEYTKLLNLEEAQ